MSGGLGEVPIPLLAGLELVDQSAQVEPGQSCSSLLHKFRLGPGLRESAHVFEVAGGEALDGWKGRAQVVRQAVDDLRASALATLPLQDVAAHLPIQQHQFAVDGQRGPLLGAGGCGPSVRPASPCSLRGEGPVTWCARSWAGAYQQGRNADTASEAEAHREKRIGRQGRTHERPAGFVGRDGSLVVAADASLHAGFLQ